MNSSGSVNNVSKAVWYSGGIVSEISAVHNERSELTWTQLRITFDSQFASIPKYYKISYDRKEVKTCQVNTVDEELLFSYIVEFVVNFFVSEDFVLFIRVCFDKLDSGELLAYMGRHLSIDVAVLLDERYVFFWVINGHCDVEREDRHDREWKFPAHNE